jgi:hypothetical protein
LEAFGIQVPQVRCTVFDVLGRTVSSWEVVATFSEITVHWDGHDGRGTAVQPGVHFFQVDAGGSGVTTVRVVLL